MILLLFVVAIIQFFTFWIFEPLVVFSTSVFEIRFLPVIALLFFIFVFSTKDNY